MIKNTTMQVEKINTHIVDWLKTYAENAKVNGFVIGISGGVDSAVTSTLCAQTGLQVLCVEMPIHQAHSHVTRGKEHIEQLKNRFPNVTSIEADLTSVFESFKKIVPTDTETNKLHLSLANTRARLRMTTLYYFAGIYGLLVAGTGNKVEDFGVGFFGFAFLVLRPDPAAAGKKAEATFARISAFGVYLPFSRFSRADSGLLFGQQGSTGGGGFSRSLRQYGPAK